MLRIDARIPVAFGPASAARPQDAVLVPPGSGPDHMAGCACCLARTPTAEALGHLFQQRARGEVPWFTRILIVADPDEEAAVMLAVLQDPVVSARFRVEQA